MILPSFVLAILLNVLPPCKTEDSANCAWNAPIREEGRGQSFVDLLGVAFY